MKISIVTVCYNSENYIRDSIESVLQQDYQNVEYIIIDGGSTDKTTEIIQEYTEELAYFISEPDKGIYDAMNKGIAVSTGDYVGILNSDDFFTHGSVLSEVAGFAKSDKDMILGSVQFVKPECKDVVTRIYKSTFFSPWMLRFGLMPPHPGAYVKRDLYIQNGFYKVGFKIAADFEYMVRSLFRKKASYVKSGTPWVCMREGGISTSGFSSYALSTKEMLVSLKENEVYSNVLFVLSRLPIKYLNKMITKT